MLSEMTGSPWHSTSTTGTWIFKGHTASSSLCKAIISHSLQGLRQSLQGGQQDRFHLRDDALCAVAGHNLGDAPSELWITQLLHSSDSGRRTKKAPPSGRCPLRRRRTRSGRCPRARPAPWRRACPSGSCPRSGPLRAQPQKQSGCVVALQWCSAAFLVAAEHSAHTRQQAQARMRPEQRLLQKAVTWHDTPCEFMRGASTPVSAERSDRHQNASDMLLRVV